MKRKIAEPIMVIAEGDKNRPDKEARLREKKETNTEIKKIGAERLELRVPDSGETTIAFICNAQDDRSVETQDFGALTPESQQESYEYGRSIAYQIFNGLENKEDKEKVDFMFVASDTQLRTPGFSSADARTSEHKRAVETADKMMDGVKDAFTELSISYEQILNNSASPEGGPIEMSLLRDLYLLEESPEVADYILEECLKEAGGNREKALKLFWIEYESDKFAQIRLDRQAEGPQDIANRVKCAINILSKAAQEYHTNNSGRRLIMTVIGHYDCMSPYIKDVIDMDMGEYLGIKKLGGIEIDVNVDGLAKAKIQGKEFDLEINN